MSKTAIVKSGERFFIKQLGESQPITLDQVIFANVPGINSNIDVDANEQMPDASQIVHVAPVTQSGLLNDRTVVYSIILDTSIGDFEFNYIGLVNAETNTLCMVMHTDLTKKIKTAGQRQGNTITESIWLEIDNASESTGITVNAETWQIDYSKRLAGEDERIRLTNYDLYNRIAINTGLNITKLHNQLTVSPGIAYINGLRVQLSESIIVVVEHNQSLYIDAWLAGTITGEWAVKFNLIAGANLHDYHDGNFQHYVERIASIDNNGNLIKVNPKSFVTTFDLASLTKTGIVKLSSAIDSTSETEAATPLAVKTAYDLANEAVKKTGATMSGQLILSELGIKHRYIDSDNLMVSRTYDDNYAHIFYDANKKQWLDKLIYNSTTNTWSFRSVDDVIINDKSVLNNYVPVGVPMAWPTGYPPSGYFECNGSSFNKNQFPKLAAAYPRGFLPDLRGEFIRGWDNGRGVDEYRGLLSLQNCMIESHNHGTTVRLANEDGGGNPWGSGGDRYEEYYTFYTTRTGGNETRPRNVAFMYIVKAE